jgi:hypothetical protein
LTHPAPLSYSAGRIEPDTEGGEAVAKKKAAAKKKKK